MAQPASARKRASRPARGARPSRPRQRRFHAQTKPRLRWKGGAVPPGRGRQLRMKVSRGQQPIAEGGGGARGATPRLRTRPGGARTVPGARAASLGGTREGRSGGDQGMPRPGDPGFKLRPPGARPRTWPSNCCKARGPRRLLEYAPIVGQNRASCCDNMAADLCSGPVLRTCAADLCCGPVLRTSTPTALLLRLASLGRFPTVRSNVLMSHCPGLC